MANTAEIKDILVSEYGYTKKDFLNEDGKALKFTQLQALLRKEEKQAKLIEDEVNGNVESNDETDSELDEFDEVAQQANTRKFKDDEMIMVMAGINGNYVHYSQAGNGRFEFKAFGQKAQMPYKELKSMNNLSRGALEKGWLIILNKDLIKEFNLEKEYTKFLTPARVNQILSIRDSSLRDIIEGLPKDMRLTLFDEAKRKINNGSIDSAFLVKTLEDIYNISFEDNLPIK